MIWFLGDFEAGFEADREASGADLKLKISIRDICLRRGFLNHQKTSVLKGVMLQE